MRRILVLNPKGGCGKSTLSTNLASHYAVKGKSVAIADFDRQSSSLDWLRVRPEERPLIHAVMVEEEKALIPWELDCVIFDAPARTHGKELKRLVKQAQTVLIPVLPSPMDMRATAQFVEELLLVGRVSRQAVRIGVVANRVREHTLAYDSLRRFLKRLGIPFVAVLRDTQNYIRAAESGLGIFELPPSHVAKDLAQWKPLIRWLNSKASLPEPARK